MKITTRGRYGLRAMLELARRFGEPPVRVETLAQKEDLSRKYLHALLTTLKSAGLVQSIRGVGGGFVLARSPSEIRLSEVLHALEGPLSLVDCVADARVCGKTNRCTTRRVWQELNRAIEDALANVTLEELIVPGNKIGWGFGPKKRHGKQSSRRGSLPPSDGASHRRRLKAGKR